MNSVQAFQVCQADIELIGRMCSFWAHLVEEEVWPQVLAQFAVY